MQVNSGGQASQAVSTVVQNRPQPATEQRAQARPRVERTVPAEIRPSNSSASSAPTQPRRNVPCGTYLDIKV